MQFHLRKLVDVDRSDPGKGYQADCTENEIFLGEGQILAADVSFILQREECQILTNGSSGEALGCLCARIGISVKARRK